MSKRLGLWAFALAVLAIAAAYGSAFLPGAPPEWAAWLLAGGTCVAMVAMMVVGASRHGRIGRRLATAFGLVLLIIGGGFALLLALPPADAADPRLVLGLPPRAAVLIYGIGLLPFFIVPLAYAWTFDEMTLGEADLERVRRAAGVVADHPGAAGGAGERESGGVGAGADSVPAVPASSSGADPLAEAGR